jgi:hypothetical protein
MSEPKDKNTPQWRDWQTRHLLGGDCAERLKIALAEKGNIEIIREFINDAVLREGE